MDIRAQHEKLIRDVASAKDARDFIVTTLRDPRVSQLLAGYEHDTEAFKETLVTEDKKNIDHLQAKISARRGLLTILRNAYSDDLERSTKQLRDFESANALFIQSEHTVDSPDVQEQQDARDSVMPRKSRKSHKPDDVSEAV